MKKIGLTDKEKGRAALTELRKKKGLSERKHQSFYLTLLLARNLVSPKS